MVKPFCFPKTSSNRKQHCPYFWHGYLHHLVLLSLFVLERDKERNIQLKSSVKTLLPAWSLGLIIASVCSVAVVFIIGLLFVFFWIVKVSHQSSWETETHAPAFKIKQPTHTSSLRGTLRPDRFFADRAFHTITEGRYAVFSSCENLTNHTESGGGGGGLWG